MSAQLRRTIILLLALQLCPDSGYSQSPTSPFELDLKDLDREKPRQRAAPKKQPARESHGNTPGATQPKTGESHQTAGSHAIYVVKRGDHIFRILEKEFGYSDTEAERLVPEITRLNRIPDIRKLTVGQNLLIPVRAPAVVRNKSVPSTSPISKTATKPVSQVGSTVEVLTISSALLAEIVDDLLAALKIPVEKQKLLHVTTTTGDVPLNISCDRYFKYRGREYIISLSNADPVTYTMLRLLEGQGYVVMHGSEGDNFTKITTDLLNLMGMTPNYGHHLLKPSANAEETFITGFQPEGNGILRGSIFITEPAGTKSSTK